MEAACPLHVYSALVKKLAERRPPFGGVFRVPASAMQPCDDGGTLLVPFLLTNGLLSTTLACSSAVGQYAVEDWIATLHQWQ